MQRTRMIKFYLDIIRPSGAETPEELDKIIEASIRESKKITEWPDPEDYWVPVKGKDY